MAWSDLEQDNTQYKKIRADAAALAKNYHGLFSSEQGQKVIEDLTNRFIMSNETPLTAANPEYEAGYHNGESGVIKYLLHQIRAAEEL